MQFGILPVNPHCPWFGTAPAGALLQALGQAGIHGDPGPSRLGKTFGITSNHLPSPSLITSPCPSLPCAHCCRDFPAGAWALMAQGDTGDISAITSSSSSSPKHLDV